MKRSAPRPSVRHPPNGHPHGTHTAHAHTRTHARKHTHITDAHLSSTHVRTHARTRDTSREKRREQPSPTATAAQLPIALRSWRQNWRELSRATARPQWYTRPELPRPPPYRTLKHRPLPPLRSTTRGIGSCACTTGLSSGVRLPARVQALWPARYSSPTASLRAPSSVPSPPPTSPCTSSHRAIAVHGRHVAM